MVRPRGTSSRDYGTIGSSDVVEKKSWIPGWVYLTLFVIVYSANNGVLAFLFARGRPFTACNILCAGNIVGLATLFPVFHGDLKPRKLRKVKMSKWAWMALGCLLANVLGSLFYLQGLALTSVPATAMMHRMEAVDFLLASAAVLGERYNGWVIFNAGLTVMGVLVAVLWPVYVEQGGLASASKGGYRMYGFGLLLLGGWGYTFSLLITKSKLFNVPTGIIAMTKIALGTLLFHIISMIRDKASFKDMYCRVLWTNMAWYGPLFVTCTQVLWLRALKRCPPTVLSIGMNTNYVATVIWGVVLLKQLPSHAEMAGGIPIVLSIISGIAETMYSDRRKKREERRSSREDVVETEDEKQRLSSAPPYSLNTKHLQPGADGQAGGKVGVGALGNGGIAAVSLSMGAEEGDSSDEEQEWASPPLFYEDPDSGMVATPHYVGVG